MAIEAVIPGIDFGLEERMSQSNAMHLGAFLETGGTMRIGLIREVGKKPRIFPEISVSDNNEARVRRMVPAYGGTVYSRRNSANSWEWRLLREPAYEWALAIKPYAPSREIIIDDFKRWGEEDLSPEQRVELFENQVQYFGVTSEEYEPLVIDPNYVAGIIDARGQMYDHVNHAKNGKLAPKPAVRVVNVNIPLMEALRKQHGGSLCVSEKPENSPNIKFKNIRYAWTLTGSRALFFLTNIQPYSVTRKEELASYLGKYR